MARGVREHLRLLPEGPPTLAGCPREDSVPLPIPSFLTPLSARTRSETSDSRARFLPVPPAEGHQPPPAPP